MNATRLFTSLLLLALLGACTKAPTTPAEQMAAADAARDAGDHQQAVALYDALLAWKGEGTVDEADRFRAALEAVKCRIAAGEAQAGVEAYKKLYESFPNAMEDEGAYKHTLAVLTRLIDEKADPMVSIELLELAGKKHAAQKENFAKLAKKLESQGLSDDQLAKLKGLGYL